MAHLDSSCQVPNTLDKPANFSPKSNCITCYPSRVFEFQPKQQTPHLNPAPTPTTMRARKAETPKSGATKKTPAKKTPPNTTPKADPKVEDASASVEAVPVTPEVKVASAAKPVAGKKTPVRATKTTPKTLAVKKRKVAQGSAGKSAKKEAPETAEKKDEAVVENVEESSKNEEAVVGDVEDEKNEGEAEEEAVVANVVETSKEEETEPAVVEEDVEEEKVCDVVDNMEEEEEEGGEGKEAKPEEDEQSGDEEIEERDDSEQVDFGEPEGEEFGDDDAVEGDEEARRLEEEEKEISDLAKERRIKKEREIFVGGLDRNSVEDDIKKVFEKIGEVIEVRLHKNPSTNKNKGYAFVKFANKETANRALSELKNPIIRGKRCGTAPSEDNDTLFVGNICNTWTKEAIKQKLKELGFESVENITLVADARHEGLSRGFAFVEFSCHADAMLAYKRLQKPDVIFGHAERTVKVAFAEPLREPDPEVMAQVKEVFIDGLPPHWDEERVREHFKPYGEIERVVLARNMPSAKRKDFGFVDYKTHEAAIACIDSVNNTKLGDENSKTKVKVRLSNPTPKIQAVKGGLCGGFRIGQAGSGFSRFGRGSGQGGRPFNRANSQRGRDFHARGRGRAGRYGFASEDLLEGPPSGFRGHLPFGQRGYTAATNSSRPDLGVSRYGGAERGRGNYIPSRRQPFSPEGHFSRPLVGRRFVDDPYLYEDIEYGRKRPYSMLGHEADYLEPSSSRARYDYPDPVAPSRGTHYQDSFEAETGLYPRDYYGSTYGGSAYSSMYGGERSYGGGYYY